MARNYSETRLHIKVADWLRGACQHVLWTHPANQGRSLAEGAKYKAMGVRAGTPDLLFWFDNKHAAIELKTTSGLSAKQKEFKRMFEAAGGLFAECKSVKAVRDQLLEWGIRPIAFPIIEPPPSKAAQIKASINYYAPPKKI